MKHVVAVLLMLTASITSIVNFAPSAFADGCAEAINFDDVHVDCQFAPDDAVALPANGDGHTYSIVRACALGGTAICNTEASCGGPPPGKLFTILRDGVAIGTTCLDDAHQAALGKVTPGLVLTAFRRLSWPSSTLALQPPDGRTLVGFATNFYTSNAEPTVQTVTLLGRRIQIEATPSTYTWAFGDGETLAGSDPGAPYPRLGVTHEYTQPGSVAPRVDTTYTGRFRIGNGSWRAIPGTLTVTGQPQSLEIREARGVLVGD